MSRFLPDGTLGKTYRLTRDVENVEILNERGDVVSTKTLEQGSLWVLEEYDPPDHSVGIWFGSANLKHVNGFYPSITYSVPVEWADDLFGCQDYDPETGDITEHEGILQPVAVYRVGLVLQDWNEQWDSPDEWDWEALLDVLPGQVKITKCEVVQ